MREQEVQAAFVAYLRDRGWTVSSQHRDQVDVRASRDAEHLVAEVKGHTSGPGLDVDTLFGQLLRRMASQPDGTRYAVVVSESLTGAVVRVPERVRRLLEIDVWAVAEDGRVRGPVGLD